MSHIKHCTIITPNCYRIKIKEKINGFFLLIFDSCDHIHIKYLFFDTFASFQKKENAPVNMSLHQLEDFQISMNHWKTFRGIKSVTKFKISIQLYSHN